MLRRLLGDCPCASVAEQVALPAQP